MLPGFRTLFAIVLLSVSVLVFGLGAAAFLRAAHDNLASTPAYRPIELAYAPRIEMPAETLSMMRVQTPTDIGTPVLLNDQPVSLSISPHEQPTPAEVAVPVRPAPVEALKPTASAPAAKTPSLAANPQKTDDLTTASVSAPQPAEPAKPAPVIESPPAPVESAPSLCAPDSVLPVLPEAKPAKTTEVIGQDSLKAADKIDAHATSPVATLQSPAPVSAEPPAVVTNPGQPTPPQSVATSEPATPAPAQIETAPKPERVAAVSEPAIPAQPSLPINAVRIPKPRIDPKVIEAQQKEQRARQQRAVRVEAQARVRARRVAAARARAAAAQTRPADPFAASPFQQPATATR